MHKINGVSIAAIILLLFYLGCASSEDQYTITIEMNPPYTGYIYIEPRQEVYRSGDVVNITAEPRGRFHFDAWGGALNPGAENPYEGFVIQENVRITANFKAGYLSDRPLLSPRKNIFYKEKPRDLYFQVHQNRHTLLSIERMGEPVEHIRQKLDNLDEPEQLPDSETIKIAADYMAQLDPGRHQIEFIFDNGDVLDIDLEIIAAGSAPCWKNLKSAMYGTISLFNQMNLAIMTITGIPMIRTDTENTIFRQNIGKNSEWVIR